MDDAGTPLFNYCDTQGYFYSTVVEKILDRAQRVFDMEIMINVKDQRQFYPAG